MNRLIEIRSYKLKAGSADAFHAVMQTQSVPMLIRWGTEIVGYGPSAHEIDTYFLVRAYDSLTDLKLQQEAFYSSQEWLRGPRQLIISHITTYLSTVLWMKASSIADLRTTNGWCALGLPCDLAFEATVPTSLV